MQYQHFKATNLQVSLFYSDYNVERAVETWISFCINSEFEAFNFLFSFVGVSPDNDDINFRVVEEYGDNDNTYHVNSINVYYIVCRH